MSKKKKGTITAAGAVVLRGSGEQREVLVVRRPAYKDWSLPKGKSKTDEDLPATAVREVKEETGVTVTLGLPLGRTKHTVDKRDKVVHWWVGRVLAERRRRPDKEVEKAVWMPLDKAFKKLSYDNEKDVLAKALDAERSGAVLVVRHGKAMLRRHWTGLDARRPLNARGRRQARRLPLLLEAYGVTEAISSTSTRCTQTLEPFATQHRLGMTLVGLLSEEEAEGHGDEVAQYMHELARRCAGEGRVVAVSGHRPVLPDMRRGLGLEDRPMLTAEVLVVHLDGDGVAIATEVHKSSF